MAASGQVQPTRALDVTDFIRIRASTDESKSTITEWQGQVLSYIPGQRPKLIFRVKGMNSTRANKLENGGYDLLSRELQLYLDPETDEVLHVWHNPWSNQDVTVVHVANNPVYQTFSATTTFEARSLPGGSYTLQISVPLAYPNPLNPTADQNSPMYSYSGSQAWYSAIESFTFTFSADAFDNEPLSVPSTQVYWTRVSPLLPFMATPDTGATLLFVANGAKVDGDWQNLSPVLRDTIEHKLPVYKEAPTSRERPGGVTSWNYFVRPEVLQAYKDGAAFPLPDPPL
ncbi:hypothetical protein H0H92_005252 [Tricholoma furcatifolium]|nr:hypothetical protein H0H92_005252 [Tricholoma furcatifolium]